MDLPQFRYHPDPIGTGSVRAGEEQCACCGERRGHVYTGPVYSPGDHGWLCPWCIADGTAHARLGASFVDPEAVDDRLPDEVVVEVATRTPAFTGWQEPMWWSHCGDAAEFLGPAGGAEIVRHGPATTEILRGNSGWPPGSSDFDDVLAGTDVNAASPIAFLFRCRVCGLVGGYLDTD